jgi:phosphate transport system protein
MTMHLQREIEKLKKLVLSLGADVEENVHKAVQALQSRDRALAEKIIAADAAVDKFEVYLEEECLKILALHQPVAIDLRFVIAVLKINNDLERIGDLAVNIAERSASLDRDLPFAVPADLRTMTETAASMLRHSLDAFVRADCRIARRVLQEDNEVDDAHRRIIVAMVELMKSSSDQVADALLIVSCSKNLERIADHATNIAEDVVYMVEGEIIRHKESLSR